MFGSGPSDNVQDAPVLADAAPESASASGNAFQTPQFRIDISLTMHAIATAVTVPTQR